MLPERWILLRGLGREAGHWHGFPEQLQLRLGLQQNAVVCLDLPGIGHQLQRRAPWSVAAMVDDVRGRWQELGGREPGRWGVLGISLGGMVALEWAARFPEDLTAAVVINSSDRRSGLWFERLRLQVLPLMLRIALARRIERREELTFRLSTQLLEGERRRELLEERIEIARERPVRAGVVARQLIAAAFWTAPRALPQPLLVMLSEGDRMVSPQCSQRLAANLGASLVRHPAAGHEIPLDDPQWVCDRLAEWRPEEPRAAGGGGSPPVNGLLRNVTLAAGWMMVFAGAITFLLPLPVGLVLLTAGFAVLIPHSRSLRRGLILLKDRWPGFRAIYHSIRARLPGPLREQLDEEDAGGDGRS